MFDFNENQKKIITLLIIVFCLALLALVGYLSFSHKPVIAPKNATSTDAMGEVVDEHFFIPDTRMIEFNEGSIISPGVYNTKLVPATSEERIIVTTAKLSLKQSYNLALPSVTKWSSDAKLVFIKSLGVLTLEGRTGEWQVIFSSVIKQRDYELIIQEDKIVAQKEIMSKVVGYDLPLNWYDSNDAILSLQSLPQFSSDSISSISFYHNPDQSYWAYGLAIAEGQKTTSMWVK